jgi:hypothetical protein
MFWGNEEGRSNPITDHPLPAPASNSVARANILRLAAPSGAKRW